MTVLVDEARWPWRGRSWAHLVSDHSYDELHDFAVRLGLRRVGFQGDHYDVDSVAREVAVRAGAEPIDSRELVRRLRLSGLRHRGGATARRWERRLDVPAGTLDETALMNAIAAALGESPVAGSLLARVAGVGVADADVTVLWRSFEVAVVIERGQVAVDLVEVIDTRPGA